MSRQGIDFLIKVNTGTDVSPVWESVGGQRGATLNRSAESIETTNKDSSGFKEFEAGFREWSIEGDGIVIDTNTGYDALETAFNNGDKVEVQVDYNNGAETQSGEAIVTDFPTEAPYDDTATYSITLQGTGALTKVTA